MNAKPGASLEVLICLLVSKGRTRFPVPVQVPQGNMSPNRRSIKFNAFIKVLYG